LRLLRQFALALLLFALISVAQTTPPLGLPFEPKVSAEDCYRQARWNGRVFVKTGRTICLSDAEIP